MAFVRRALFAAVAPAAISAQLSPMLKPELVSQGVAQGRAGEDDGNFVFLQRFNLEGIAGLFYHTEVVVCPRQGFSSEDQQLLDGKIAGMTDFAELSASWWESKSVDCVELGYGGSYCDSECCSVGHQQMKLQERKAVISNANLKTKALFIYGTGSFDGDVAFHHTCDSKCWSNWKGTDYSILGNNCNTFTSTVLSCVYGLSQKKPHLGVSDLVTVHGHCPASGAADLHSKVAGAADSSAETMVIEHSTESETGSSANQCTDSCKLEGDALCHGDAYKVIDTDPTLQECCDACAADAKCVQWGYADPSISSKCYLSSTVTTAQAKWGSTCGRKSTSGQDVVV